MKKRVRRWSQDDLNRIRDIKCHILENLGSNLSQEILARKTAMNPKKLRAGFLFLFVTEINRFILQSRMEKAHRCLLETDSAIKEINGQCGYGNLASFYRAFTAYYGYTPASLRNLP